MICKIVVFSFVLNAVLPGILTDDSDDASYIPVSGNAPFFELPCMVVGGTCARSFACPPATAVSMKALCPVQQDQGIECCRPVNNTTKCKDRGGSCVTDEDKCPPSLLLKDAIDCVKSLCCVIVK